MTRLNIRSIHKLKSQKTTISQWVRTYSPLKVPGRGVDITFKRYFEQI